MCVTNSICDGTAASPHTMEIYIHEIAPLVLPWVTLQLCGQDAGWGICQGRLGRMPTILSTSFEAMLSDESTLCTAWMKSYITLVLQLIMVETWHLPNQHPTFFYSFVYSEYPILYSHVHTIKHILIHNIPLVFHLYLHHIPAQCWILVGIQLEYKWDVVNNLYGCFVRIPVVKLGYSL